MSHKEVYYTSLKQKWLCLSLCGSRGANQSKLTTAWHHKQHIDSHGQITGDSQNA